MSPVSHIVSKTRLRLAQGLHGMSIADAFPEGGFASPFWSVIVALRRELHANPEPGFREFATQVRKILFVFRHAEDIFVRPALVSAVSQHRIFINERAVSV